MHPWSTPGHDEIIPLGGADPPPPERAAGVVPFRMVGGFKDATQGVSGVVDSIGAVAVDTTAATRKAVSRKPTKEVLLEDARKREAEADLNDAADSVEDTLNVAKDTQ